MAGVANCVPASAQPRALGSTAAAPQRAPETRVPRVLIGPGLESRVGALAGVAGSQITFVSSIGRESVVPARDVLAILPVLGDAGDSASAGSAVAGATRATGATRAAPGSPTARAGGDGIVIIAGQPVSSGWVELIDGQLFPGAPMSTDAIRTDDASNARPDASESTPFAEAIAWATPSLGDLLINLEGVSMIVVEPRTALALLARPQTITKLGSGDASDRVVLLNGDVVAGFVESVSPEGVIIDEALASESAASPAPASTIALGRVALIKFANPAQPPSGPRFWLYDATVASVAPTASAGQTSLSVSPSGPWVRSASGSPTKFDVTSLRAFTFDASRLVALSSLVPSVQGSEQRRWTPPPIFAESRGNPLGIADIELPGAMRTTWTLPASATHVSMRLELAEDARTFGDCVVRVEIVGDEARGASARLNAAAPMSDVRLAIPRGSSRAQLRIAVEAGQHGSIQDRVLIRRGLVLLAGDQGAR
jgi:hypothetical protein